MRREGERHASRHRRRARRCRSRDDPMFVRPLARRVRVGQPSIAIRSPSHAHGYSAARLDLPCPATHTSKSLPRTMSTVPWVANRYPATRRSDHVEVYKSAKEGEVKVADPYVWLEENTPETEEWVSTQESFTREFLDQLPDRERLEKAIRANTDYPRVSTELAEGQRARKADYGCSSFQLQV
jgi:hypothetical protein